MKYNSHYIDYIKDLYSSIKKLLSFLMTVLIIIRKNYLSNFWGLFFEWLKSGFRIDKIKLKNNWLKKIIPTLNDRKGFLPFLKGIRRSREDFLYTTAKNPPPQAVPLLYQGGKFSPLFKGDTAKLRGFFILRLKILTPTNRGAPLQRSKKINPTFAFWVDISWVGYLGGYR